MTDRIQNWSALTPLRTMGFLLLLTVFGAMLNCGSGNMLPMMPMHGSPIECGGMFSDELSISFRDLSSPLLIILGLLGAAFVAHFRKAFDWFSFEGRFKLLLRASTEQIPDLLTQLFSSGILHPKIY